MTRPTQIALMAAALGELATTSPSRGKKVSIETPYLRSYSDPVDHELVGKDVVAGGYHGKVLEVRKITYKKRLKAKVELQSKLTIWEWVDRITEVADGR